MSNILIILLFTISFLGSGCLPNSERVLPATDVEEVDNSVDPTETEGNDSYQSPYWYDVGTKYTTLTIDYDNNKTHYIFGSDVHSYLSNEFNYNSPHCLIVTFNNTSSPSTPLAVKAIPAVTIDYSTGNRTRYFRVNLASESGNSFCQKTLMDTNGAPLGSIATLAYKASDVCPSCLNILASDTLTLYKYFDDGASGFLRKVSNSIIPYNDLSLRIDMNGNSSGNTNNCTNTECASQGFDCCVNGQCVNEAGIKMSAAQADPTGFNLAELEKTSNSKWYLNYPQYYYICLEDPGDDSDDTLDPEDPEGDAQTRLEAMIEDFECIEELKTNSVEDPFHIDPIDESLAASTYTECEISDTTSDMYYESVMKRLYANCGCAVTSSLDDMVESCPAYTYQLVYQNDIYGQPTTTVADVACYTPTVVDNDLPFQDLEIAVNSRSAPHRFFTEDNEEYDPYDDDLVLSGSTTQEGDAFEYLDNDGVFPLNGSFNMNSVLGQMTVNLDQARPARKIDLEYDKVYYIAALSGSYTACPTCSKDSWFTNFSPYPTTNYGLGIRASGFTTSRDSWGSNSSFGNYEDTIFGRACWLPPTMVPFGHNSDSDQQTQRLNRLQTQAALYINGYQRDWFGFNRGALIGSFDGVTWFAIGKGRKVRATTDRLYLAINAPFADLASPSDHIVSVQEYDFITTAAEYDYNPEEEINSPYQNEAGLCQKYHECETDSHCVSKLGWEYSCVDVYQYKTKWPKFEAEGASEIAGEEKTGALAEFLQQGGLAPGDSSKKCVYRGAGAPCRMDISNVANEGLRRALSCAPNFYCANLASADFTKEVARFATTLENIVESKNHYYGQDANVLGRPKDYIAQTSASTLPTQVKTNLQENFELMDSSTSQMGVCRPGKSLPSYDGTYLAAQNTDQLIQHASKDVNSRTDFISQIAGCNATMYNSMRYSSCPMFNEDGDYLHLTDEYMDIGAGATISVEDSFYDWTFSTRDGITKYYSTQQNMCGLESIDSGVFSVYGLSETVLRSSSAFESIEARDLTTSDVQIEPTLVQNACFRRAGSICHTDYDCAPNFKHSELIDILNPDLFGNTAEKKFWEEYLVCGQAQSEPVLSSSPTDDELDDYNSYSFHNNRCCREVGKDITLYTEDSPNASESEGLRTDLYGGFNPNDANRYSRYAASLPQVDDSTLEATADGTFLNYSNRVTAIKPNDPNYTTGNPSILTNNQWKNVHDAAARTCCGGSWVRKFADGTNNWSIKRLNLDVNDFQCLNYRTPLVTTDSYADYDPGSITYQTGADLKALCEDPTQAAGGCAQVSIDDGDGFSTEPPTLDETLGTMIIDSEPDRNTNLGYWSSYPWAFSNLLASDQLGGYAYMDWSYSQADIENDGASRQVITTRVPSFIPMGTVADIRLEGNSCSSETLSSNTCSGGWNGLCDAFGATARWSPDIGGTCGYLYDPSTRILKVTYNNTILNGTINLYGSDNKSIEIEFTAPGTLQWEQNNVVSGTLASDEASLPHRRSSSPGNALYYMEKLAKLEYIGIPQMTYDPIFCNDNYLRLVPGIFTEDMDGSASTTGTKDGWISAEEFINYDANQDGVTNTFTDTRKDTTEIYWDIPASTPAGYNPENTWTNDELRKVATQEELDLPQIFSDNEFKCCLPLGSDLGATEDASMCCSGTRKEDNGNYTCALPEGTDLFVYFNKYVSGEGLDSTYLNGAQPLTIEDFDEQTGAPQTTQAVFNKLSAIGAQVCASGAVTQGGFYGEFEASPSNSESDVSVNGFVDSASDEGNINNLPVGFSRFSEGYRWWHHVYCAPEGS